MSVEGKELFATRPFRFAAERPLGRLAKWLRLMGFDTLYDRGGRYDGALPDGDANRIRLTRRTGLKNMAHKAGLIFIENNDVFAQLKQVVSALSIEASDLVIFSRCLRCNREIEKIEKDAVRGRVPDYVWQTQTQFSRCRNCGRYFWPGSHSRRVEDRLKELFGPSTQQRLH